MKNPVEASTCAFNWLSHSAGTTALALPIIGLLLPVHGQQIYVESTGVVGEYNADGSAVNASLITGLSGYNGLAISGDDLFVANQNFGVGSVGEYTTSGGTINASLITGLAAGDGTIAPAVSGNSLFVFNPYGGGERISEYTMS